VLASLFACDRTPPKAPIEGAQISAPVAAPPTNRPAPDISRCDAGYRKLFDGMRDEMTIDAFLSRGAPQLDAKGDAIAAVLGKLRAASRGKLKVRIVTPNDPIDRQTALAAGLLETTFGESPDGNSAVLTRGFLGIVLTSGLERDSIAQVGSASNDAIGYWIANKVRELRDRAEGRKHRIGLLTGHGEIRIDAPDLVPANVTTTTLASIVTQHYPMFAFDDVDLDKTHGDIDPALAALIVTQPERELSPEHLHAIDRFVRSGKTLVVFASAANVKAGDTTMQATLDRHGIEHLLSGYGIEMSEDVLVDFEHAFSVAMTLHGGATTVRLPQIPTIPGDGELQPAPWLDASSPPFFLLPDLAFPFASSLELRSEHQPRAKFAILARTSPMTEALTGRTVDLRPYRTWKPVGGDAHRIVAASVTGPLGPAFADTKSDAASESASASSRVLVIASSQLLANPLVRAGQRDPAIAALAMPYFQSEMTTVILAFKNILDWIANDDDLVACANPPQKTDKK
jgi:hypothetical protein